MYENCLKLSPIDTGLSRVLKFPDVEIHSYIMYLFYWQRGFKNKKTIKDSLRLYYSV